MPDIKAGKTMYQGPDKDIRLHFLDGIRALAAFYVLLFHYVATGHNMGIPGVPYTSLLMFGHEAVVVFIVVSGYCLMLSPLQSADGSMRGGWARFLRRRAWRILPPYYAALFMWPVFLISVRAVKYLFTGVPDFADVVDMLGNGNLLSHLGLVHNMRSDWNGAINPALWSIATEFQIYILFIWILLPLWRRLGNTVTVVVAFAIGLVPLFLLPPARNLAWAAPHFVGLFALGMVAAVISLSNEPRSHAWREAVPWGIVAVAFSGVFLCLVVAYPDMRLRLQWLTDTIIGFGAAAWIIFCASKPEAKRSSSAQAAHRTMLRVLESTPLTSLGRFSYSLYLVHLPVLAIASVSLSYTRISASILESRVFSMIVLVPLAVVAAYIFYMVVERKFIPGPSTRRGMDKQGVTQVDDSEADVSAAIPHQ